MREMPAARRKRAFKRTRLALFLLVVALCASNSGCFVLTSEWRTKPEAPAQAIELHKDSDGKTYSRIFDTLEFRVEVTIKNGPVRWEAPFLFYVLPIPVSYRYLATQPLCVDLALQPRGAEIA